MPPDIDKLLALLDANPTFTVTRGDLAVAIRAVLKVVDDKMTGANLAAGAFVGGALRQVAIDRQASINELTQQFKGYVDAKVEQVERSLTEARRATAH